MDVNQGAQTSTSTDEANISYDKTSSTGNNSLNGDIEKNSECNKSASFEDEIKNLDSSLKYLRIHGAIIDFPFELPTAKTETEISQMREDYKNKIKREDVMRLINMFNIVKHIENENVELSDIFIQLGNFSGGEEGLTFNEKDEESFWIRNRHGYIPRNKLSSDPNASNENGIYFEKLYNLKFIFKQVENLDCSNKHFQDDFEAQKDLLKIDLFNLREKLKRILIDEKDYVESIQVLQEIESWKVDQMHSDSSLPITNIIEFSKKHYEQFALERIKYELSQLEAVDLTILENRYYFARVFTIICELISEILEDHDKFSLKNKKGKLQGLKKLRSIFIKRHQKYICGNELLKNSLNIQRSIANIKANIKSELANDSLLANIISDIDKMLESDKQPDETTKSIKKTVKKLKENNIEIKMKTLLMESYEITQSSKYSSDKKQQILDLKNRLYQALKKDLLQKFAGSDVHLTPYPDVINEEEILKFENLIKTMMAKPKSQENNTENKEFENSSIKASSKSEKSFGKIIETLILIGKEIQFLMRLKINNIDDIKKDYVIEHSATIIGQCMRDLDNFDTSKMIKKISSRIISEGRNAAKAARNEGLGHNIFALDRSTLKQRLRNDILPSYKNFMTLGYIYEYSKTNFSLSTVYELASSFYELGCYLQAQYLYDLFVNLVETASNSGLKIEHSETGQVLNPRVLAIIGKRRIAEIHHCQGNYEESLEILSELFDEIDNLDTNQSDQKIVAIFILKHKSDQMMVQKKYEEAAIFSERAASLAPDYFNTKKDLLYIYWKLNKNEKLSTLVQYMEENYEQFNTGQKYFYLVFKIENLLDIADEKVITEIEENVLKIENMLNQSLNTNDIKYFKEQFYDFYQVVWLKPILFRLYIISAKLQLLSCYSFAEIDQDLRELETTFKEVLGNLSPEIRNNAEVMKVFEAFASAFLNCWNNLDYHKIFKVLLKVDKYLNKASVNPYPNNNLTTIAGSLASHFYHIAVNSALDEEIKHKWFEKALSVQTTYKHEPSQMLINLGKYFYTTAQDIVKNPVNQMSLEKAILNYQKAILYLEKVEQHNEDSLIRLAISYDVVGANQNNIDFRRKALEYYDKYHKLVPKDSSTLLLKFQCQMAIEFAALSISKDELKKRLKMEFEKSERD